MVGISFQKRKLEEVFPWEQKLLILTTNLTIYPTQLKSNKIYVS